MLFVDDFQVLIVPGLHNSDARHWQTRWQVLYPAFTRVEQQDWHTPDLAAWKSRVQQAVAAAHKPIILVAHSFGCLASVASAADSTRIAAALLVAPADPAKFKVEGELESVRLRFPSVLIASENDPWLSSRQASYWASRWGCDYVNIGLAGHINSDSGLSDWLLGLTQLQRLALKAHLAHHLPSRVSSADEAKSKGKTRAFAAQNTESGYLEMNKYYF